MNISLPTFTRVSCTLQGLYTSLSNMEEIKNKKKKLLSNKRGSFASFNIFYQLMLSQEACFYNMLLKSETSK